MVKLYSAVIFLLSVFAFQSVFGKNVTTSIISAVLRNKDKNVIFSPLLVTEGLWRLYLGAGGETAVELDKVLQLNGQNKYTALDWYIYSRPQKNKELKSANTLFIAKNLTILDTYLSVDSIMFQSSPQRVDFGNSNATTRLINDWVDKETNHKITKLIDETDDSVALIFLSAMYFKGLWKYPFDSKNTRKAKFYVPLKNGDIHPIEVDMMTRKGKCSYKTIPKLDAVSLELPYENSNMSMVILLPNLIEGIGKVINNMGQMDINEITPNLAERTIKLSMPKFKFDVKVDLIDSLKSLGLVGLFTKADLSALTDSKNIVVSKFLQKAVIEVDEEGSTASAAQETRSLYLSGTLYDDHFHINHPFIFLIKDNDFVYFSGLVTME